MGLLFRRRRPLRRLAAGAAVGTVAYQAGTRYEAQDGYNGQAQAAYDATQQQAPAAAPPASTDSTSELERLASLHCSGALTDEEFTAAKAKLLGV